MSKRVDSKAVLLWVDLEMTGLDPNTDKILEVAAIATNWEMEELDSYTGVVHVDEAFMRERMVGEFWEKHEDSFNGLMAQNADGESAEKVEKDLLKFVEENFDETVYLAGNSIHQDRKFIEREWPKLNEKLHYRLLDVSAWKVYFEGALGQKFMKPENHRALDDIRGSMAELQWYLKRIK